MTIEKINEIAGEEYDIFYEKCCEEAIAECNGDKVAGLNRMQGFDYPDSLCILDDWFEDFCEKSGFVIPEGAIGGSAIKSADVEPEFIFPSTLETAVRRMAQELYYD